MLLQLRRKRRCKRQKVAGTYTRRSAIAAACLATTAKASIDTGIEKVAIARPATRATRVATVVSSRGYCEHRADSHV